MGLISFIPVLIFLKKESCYPVASLVIYFVLLFKPSEYLYRQWMAVIILFFSYKFIRDRKLIKFLCCCILAAFFHRSALLFVIAYPLNFIKITKVKLLFSMAFSAFLGITGKFWFTFFSQFARIELEQGMRGGVFMLLFLWLCVFIIYFVSGKTIISSQYKIYFLLLWFAAVTQPIAFTFSLWSRALLYFRVSLMVLLPKALGDLLYNERNRRFAMPVEILFYVLLFVLLYSNGIDTFVLCKA